MAIFEQSNHTSTYTGTETAADVNPSNVFAVTLSASYNGKVYNYSYKNSVQSFTTEVAGYYKIEAWGASGGDGTGINKKYGGKGGYTTGKVYIGNNVTLYLATGGKGGDVMSGSYDPTGVTPHNATGGYNGGQSATGFGQCWGAAGGGATHLVTSNRGTLDNYKDYKTNVLMVAGAGGGSSVEKNNRTGFEGNGGYGGGLTASPGLTDGNTQCRATEAATQTVGGSGCGSRTGDFGTAVYSASDNDGGGGGSGWYGGGSAVCSGGGGGSSYINGLSGSTRYNTQYIFSNAQTISGNASMPNTAGTGTEVGHTGNGFVKITYLGLTI